jgi:hypothetical protein
VVGENYVWHVVKLKKERWKAETSVENREAADLMKKTSEEENDSDDWPVTLE